MDSDTPLPAIVAALERLKELKQKVYNQPNATMDDWVKMKRAEMDFEEKSPDWLRWCVEEIERWKKARDEMLDYSIALQKLIEHTVRGETVDESIGKQCPHHEAMARKHVMADSALARENAKIIDALKKLQAWVELSSGTWSVYKNHEIKGIVDAALRPGAGEGGKCK